MIWLQIGIDDTDSPFRGCTTYIASVLIERLSQLGGRFFDYPNLIRLNPNIPWKTRGNGAICLRLFIDEGKYDAVVEEVLETIEKESDFTFPKTDPGVVFYIGKKIPLEIRKFARKTIQDVVKKEEALKLIKHCKAEAIGYKDGRGIIGAIAAIGETLDKDYTYEFIAYRTVKNRGTPRRVKAESVFQMDKSTRGLVFNNVDYDKKRVLIAPRGKDPVLLGIRGENPEILKKAYDVLKINEKVERWSIFRTNQGTDSHLKMVKAIKQIRPCRPVMIVGVVTEEPRMIPGRHVVCTIGDKTGEVDCAAYEPTGKFRNVIKKLTRNDVVKVFGGVRPPSSKHPITINLEKIQLLKLVSKTIMKNPMCKKCGKHMESMGKNKGFRCKKCRNKAYKAKKTIVKINRLLHEGLYIPPPRANRHLTKPFSRYGIEKEGFNKFFPNEFWGLKSPQFNLTNNST